jgi:hypothetical protein
MMSDDEAGKEDEGNESTDASPDDDGSKEEEGEGEMLGHSIKPSHSFYLRDWSEDDDDDVESPAALEATVLHVAAVAAAGGRVPLVVTLPDTLV